jgi:CRISPR/Cas system-associated endonuclease Cas1
MELYRYLIDDFLLDHCRKLKLTDFIVKTENQARKRKGKREYLNNKLTRNLMKKLESVFQKTVEIPRIKVGKKQTIETLINEEALLLAKFLRNERKQWKPRLPTL